MSLVTSVFATKSANINALTATAFTIGSTALTATGTELNQLESTNNATNIGAINAATGLSLSIVRVGPFYRLDFTLAAVSIAVTDGTVLGAYGSLKLFDFVQSSVSVLGCRQNYTAFAEGAALTGAAGDAAFVMGLGSVAIAAALDGVLSTATTVDMGTATSTITLSGGTGTGTKHNGPLGAIDGTSTATDIYLNWAGSALTIDANSTIAVTGTISILVALMGDD